MIRQLLRNLSAHCAIKDRQVTIRSGRCITCAGTVGAFRSAWAAREYAIGGMCQQCQDEGLAFAGVLLLVRLASAMWWSERG